MKEKRIREENFKQIIKIFYLIFNLISFLFCFKCIYWLFLLTIINNIINNKRRSCSRKKIERETTKYIWCGFDVTKIPKLWLVSIDNCLFICFVSIYLLYVFTYIIKVFKEIEREREINDIKFTNKMKKRSFKKKEKWSEMDTTNN